MSKEKNQGALVTLKDTETEITPLFQRSLSSVREEMIDSPYIAEALRVLSVGGYRSAIGSVWNAVVDDLRNKIMHRSLPLFNKKMTSKIGRQVNTYEDFQNHVNDDELIEGAYEIGVISWEASKVLKHAKETRHIFDGHPKSSEPSIFKVLAMFDDCAKYVLRAEYPPQIIDIGDYISNMDTANFDRNMASIENALGDLPELYRTELINRLFSAYTQPNSSSALRSNIEVVLPHLWVILPKREKLQVVQRVDGVMNRGNEDATKLAFAFVRIVQGNLYLTQSARRYIIEPILQTLEVGFEKFSIEDVCIKQLEPYGAYVPQSLLSRYVTALTRVYVGFMGGSARFSRTDFYADTASSIIPTMFQAFDDNAANEFVVCLKKDPVIRSRVEHYPVKLGRARNLANIVLERISEAFPEREFLNLLVDSSREAEFWTLLRKQAK